MIVVTRCGLTLLIGVRYMLLKCYFFLVFFNITVITFILELDMLLKCYFFLLFFIKYINFTFKLCILKIMQFYLFFILFIVKITVFFFLFRQNIQILSIFILSSVILSSTLVILKTINNYIYKILLAFSLYERDYK